MGLNKRTQKGCTSHPQLDRICFGFDFPRHCENSKSAFHRTDIMLLQDQRKSGKGVREAIAMANQAFHLELNVSSLDFLWALDLDCSLYTMADINWIIF